MKKQLKDTALLKEKRIKVRLSRVMSLGLAGAEGREGLGGGRTARLQGDRLGLNNRADAAQKACKGKTGWLGEQKQGTDGGQARVGQAEEAEEIEYTYRPVLATTKKPNL